MMPVGRLFVDITGLFSDGQRDCGDMIVPAQSLDLMSMADRNCGLRKKARAERPPIGKMQDRALCACTRTYL